MKQLNNLIVTRSILKTIEYFYNFDYYPTLNEIYTFLKVKVSKTKLESELKRLKYTPPQYSIERKILNIKYQISKKKLNSWRYLLYVKLVSLFPQIRLIGLSGSISMMNAEEGDDIDLFIITAKNRLFTGRFIALALAQLLGLRRSRGEAVVVHDSSKANKDKVCLNLFFDERELNIPKFKQTEFVGHEVLQMKPIIVKGNIYEKFLESNLWVTKFFPNSRQIFNFQFSIFNEFKNLNFKNSKLNKNFKLKIKNLNDHIESQLKRLQLQSINKHKTTELITDSQLWFHPDDFEKKLNIK